MAIEVSSLLALRRDPRLLKFPPYLSALCILVGLAWLLLLPLNEYSRRTYISENALLPGQVHTYFGGSEQSVWSAYKYEVQALAHQSEEQVTAKLSKILKAAGLKVATQKYEYGAAGNRYSGENVYAILHAPRGDATEAIVLVAAWRNMDGDLNQGGVALVLTLSKYFKRWSLWSKDIIILITPDSKAGPQAWADAYHDAHSSPAVQSLALKSGALQGAVVVDNALNQRFESLHIAYDGINGQLPNLDLFNTAVSIASGQMGIGIKMQKMWKHDDSYKDRLKTMLRGMASQGLGHASGPHSSFIPYHVDAITLTALGEGWQDEMAMGRCDESIFRSLNNLLEHLHQSFFFYLLMHPSRFVSIGTYLPSAMLVAVSFTIMAISLWLQSGRPTKAKLAATTPSAKEKAEKPETEVVVLNSITTIVPKQELSIIERQLLLPLAVVLGLHYFGIVPLYIFNNFTQTVSHPHPKVQHYVNKPLNISQNLAYAFYAFALSNTLLPTLLSNLITQYTAPTTQQRLLIKCFSLLLLGMFLATLSTLNFSLAFLVGLLASPLSFLGVPSSTSTPDEQKSNAPEAKRKLTSQSLWILIPSNVILHTLSPPIVILAVCYLANVGIEQVLVEAAFGWQVWSLWTPVIIWCVWWPAWLVGAMFVSPLL